MSTFNSNGSLCGASFFISSLFHLFVGLTFAVIIICIPTTFWEISDRLFLALGILLLILVFFPGIGSEVNGAYRWLKIGPVGLQPSEIMKFFTLVYISGYSMRRLRDLQSHWFGKY